MPELSLPLTPFAFVTERLLPYGSRVPTEHLSTVAALVVADLTQNRLPFTDEEIAKALDRLERRFPRWFLTVEQARMFSRPRPRLKPDRVPRRRTPIHLHQQPKPRPKKRKP